MFLAIKKDNFLITYTCKWDFKRIFVLKNHETCLNKNISGVMLS